MIRCVAFQGCVRMWFRALSAGVGVVLSASIALAQAGGDLRGPREAPPSDFRGGQFVDSAGCVFVRAGLSGRTTWVPRIGANRQQLCGRPPSFAAQAPIAMAEQAPAVRQQPAAPVALAPPVAPQAETRRVATTQQPARAASPAPRSAVVAAAPTVRVTPGCAPHAPHGERLLLTDGRFTLVCFRDSSFVPTWAIRQGEARTDCAAAPGGPVVQRRDGSRAALCAPGGHGQGAAPVGRGAAPTSDIAAAIPPVPRGFKPAWQDDRLNPLRGQGTAQGQARQNRIWTQETPMRLVEEKPARKASEQVTLSASGAASGIFVQVGSFAQPANADRARARLAGLGLPVAQAQARGQMVVMAGPFADRTAARQAQARARQAGFSDAFIR